MNALDRCNVPEETLQELRAMYASITLRIRDAEDCSTERQQKTGIRQGCPLSPYLFILLMSTLTEDALKEAGSTDSVAPKDAGTPLLLYADDTMIISNTASKINKMLAAIQKHSDRHGLKLNMRKCDVIAMNTKSKVSIFITMI